MRITFLLLWADSLGGTERAVLTQAEYLAGRGEDVEILSVFRSAPETFFAVDPRVRMRYLVDLSGPVPRPVRECGLTDATCLALASRGSRLVPATCERSLNALTDVEMEQALRDLDTDVVVSTSPALMGLATTLVPPRIVVVHQEHRVSQLRGGTGQPLYTCTPRVDALVVLTEPTRAWFASTFGDACPRTEVIPNTLPPGHRPRSSLRHPYVVMAGRLVAEKRVDHAIRAFALVAKQFPDWVLRIFGDGPQAADLRRLVAAMDLHDNVQMPGPTTRMPHEWAKASLALLSSSVEAFPLVLLEAFAAGVPAVSYDIPTGPVEIITHGRNGLLVQSGDEEGLAQAMIDLIGDPERRAEFGTEARRASGRYDIDVVMSRWERLYAELLDGRDRAAPARADRLAAWVARTGGTGFAPTTNMPTTREATVDTAAAERRIRARHPDLVRAGGHLSVVSDEMTPADVAHDNFTRVVGVLERARLPYWVIRDPGVRHRVALRSACRDDAVAALAKAFADAPVYAETLGRGGRPSAVLLASCLDVAPSVPWVALRVFRPVVTTSRTLWYGPAHGCDLEFWESSADGAELTPTRRTLLGDAVTGDALAPATTTIRGREHPTLAGFTRRLMFDVDFPVDIVYTWVDGNDPEWQARRDRLWAELDHPPVAAAGAAARFRERDELRYSLRSVDMFAPWVRHVFIVTAGQRPSWLDDTHPQITVVDHRDVFGDRGTLPTFNSHAIESQLHRIDGLAEHFLYFNDDVFIGRPQAKTTFFHANGAAKFFVSPTRIPFGPVLDTDDLNISAAKNNRRLLEDRFDRTLTHGLLHAPHAMRRSVAAAIDDEFADAVAATAQSQLRAHGDHSIASSLHHYYGFLTGQSMPGTLRVAYINTGDPAAHPSLSRILGNREYDVFCLNDTHHGALSDSDQRLIVAAFLESYLPVASRFERGSPRNRADRPAGRSGSIASS
jgi:glycosyltransferase involved in cell wall biosynthesis